MNFELYSDKNTFFHQLDPRAKLILAFLTFAMILIPTRLSVLAMVIILVIIQGIICRSLKNILKVWVIMFFIAAAALVIWSVFAGGQTKVWGPFTREGLKLGLFKACQLEALIITGLWFISTTSPEAMTQGLRQMGMPYPICFAIAMAFRLVPGFFATGQAVKEAQEARGLDLNVRNPITRFRRNIPLLGPIFLTILRNTNQMSFALESRGFGSYKTRTSLITYRMNLKDYLAVFIAGIFLAIVIYIRIAF
jgi:energy-coupling factor transport system permease protein